ncbi:MAG TPA: porin family protein [Gemmatimonadales bacterium]
MTPRRGTLLAFVAASVSAVAPVAAQRAAHDHLALIGGIVSSNWGFTGGPSEGQHGLVGFVAGIGVAPPVGQSFAFAPELLYVSKGASLLFGGNVQIDFRLHYIEAPLLYRYAPTLSRSIHPFLTAGPEFSVRAACSAKATNSPGNGGTVSVERCITGFGQIPQDEPNWLDFGVIAGAGVRSGRLSASVRYDAGLTDIYSRYGVDGSKTRNTAWLFAVAVER